MIIAEFSMVPMGTGTSASRYVKEVYKVLEKSGLRFLPGPMSTSLEAESLREIFDVIEEANEALARSGVRRIITSVKIDDRRDKDISIDTKLEAARR